MPATITTFETFITTAFNPGMLGERGVEGVRKMMGDFGRGKIGDILVDELCLGRLVPHADRSRAISRASAV